MTGFAARVLAVLQALEAGQVVTYGEVAAEAGYPGAARAVGNLLRDLPPAEGGWGSDAVPWWRVVTASGRVCPTAVAEATRRLSREGVVVRDGHVVGLETPSAEERPA